MAGAGLVCTVVAILAAQSVLSRLGVTENDARSRFLSAMNADAWPGLEAKAFLALPPAGRAAAVTETVDWAKAYLKSPTFAKAWADAREQNKPTAPEAVSTDAAIAKQNADQQKQLEDLKKMAASLPPDQRQAIEASIKQMEAMAADPKMQAMQRQTVDAQHADDQAKYQKDLKEWQDNYPADPKVIVARKLHDFLTMSADVDFDAQLVPRNGKKYFANLNYEMKPAPWKFCFRAGREAVTAARNAATAWLKELGQ